VTKFLPLILANLGRKKVRTILTLGSFGVALFLFGLLAALRDAFSLGVEVAGADRLMVVNKVSIVQPLRYAYAERMRRIPGVTTVSSFAWFGGVYQDEKNFFAQFAIEPEHHLALYPEFVVPAEQWQAFLADKTGAIAGKALAERFGWKVGDRIPIRGTVFSGTWEFNLVGIYGGTRQQDDLTQFWFRRDYLEDRAPQWWRGLVGWFGVKIASPDDAVKIARQIDEAFANSAWETRTQTEKAMAASFAKQMGNIELLILAIGGVVFFTLLLVAGSTMATVVRERTGELAVLKALGYSDGFVLGLVLVESSLVAGVGGALGLASAWALAQRGDPTGGMLPYFYVSRGALLAGSVAALSVGIVAGLLPALSASRLRVVDALRRI
jgi:putative ABC transport system permease protein